MPSIIADILFPLGLSPIFMTDGDMVYGTAVPIPTGTPLLYAPQVNGATGAHPTGTYTATGQAGTPSRSYISGHLPQNNFTPFNAGSYWYIPLDDAVLAAWDRDGDWLLIASLGYQGAAGANTGYTIAQSLIAPLPSPYTSGTAPWFGWGGQIDAGSGYPYGFFANNTAFDVKVNPPFVSTIANAFAVTLIHKLGNTCSLYFMQSPGLQLLAQNVAYPTPGLPNPIPGYHLIVERSFNGCVDMPNTTQYEVGALIPGTMTLATVTAIAQAIVTGVAVFSILPPTTPTNLLWAGCSGPSNTLTWAGINDHYLITRDGALIGSTIPNSFADSTARLGVSYTYGVQAVNTIGQKSSVASITVTTCATTGHETRICPGSPVTVRTCPGAPVTTRICP